MNLNAHGPYGGQLEMAKWSSKQPSGYIVRLSGPFEQPMRAKREHKLPYVGNKEEGFRV